MMVILIGRGYVVKTGTRRGYVVNKVGIELLGQLKMRKVENVKSGNGKLIGLCDSQDKMINKLFSEPWESMDS